MDNANLFPLPPSQSVGPPNESYSQKVSRRKREMLENGVNPGSGRPLMYPNPTNETCGSCKFIIDYDYGRRRFFKCSKGKTTASEVSDIRKRWPACKGWEPK